MLPAVTLPAIATPNSQSATDLIACFLNMTFNLDCPIADSIALLIPPAGKWLELHRPACASTFALPRRHGTLGAHPRQPDANQ
jgi:hypothetical protein